MRCSRWVAMISGSRGISGRMATTSDDGFIGYLYTAGWPGAASGEGNKVLPCTVLRGTGGIRYPSCCRARGRTVAARNRYPGTRGSRLAARTVLLTMFPTSAVYSPVFTPATPQGVPAQLPCSASSSPPSDRRRRDNPSGASDHAAADGRIKPGWVTVLGTRAQTPLGPCLPTIRARGEGMELQRSGAASGSRRLLPVGHLEGRDRR